MVVCDLLLSLSLSARVALDVERDDCAARQQRPKNEAKQQQQQRLEPASSTARREREGATRALYIRALAFPCRTSQPPASTAANLSHSSMSSGGDGSVGPGEVPKQARESLKIMQIQGSSAGSGSGDFHTYRNARNLERERIARMEREAKAEEERAAFERQRAIANFHLDAAAKSKTSALMHCKAHSAAGASTPRSLAFPPRSSCLRSAVLCCAAACVCAEKAEKRKRKKEHARETEKRTKLEASNAIANDGSFLEQFLKQQQQAAAAAAATTSASSSASTSSSAAAATPASAASATQPATAATPPVATEKDATQTSLSATADAPATTAAAAISVESKSQQEAKESPSQ